VVYEILDAEFARYPEAETAIDRHIRRFRHRYNERKDAELKLADLIVVNSRFTQDSLLRVGIPRERIKVVPLGAPTVNARVAVKSKSPFIFLSVGTQSVRKGVHYLLEAWRKLRPAGDVELWLIGHMSLPMRMFDSIPGKLVIRRSVPKNELYEMYRHASVLVFPSLCEGFGMVITEAMAQGLPVITTPSTGGPEFIEHGHSGFLVPIRDVDRLGESMQWCLDNRQELVEMGNRAAESAAKWQWSNYRAMLGKTVLDLVSRGNSVTRTKDALLKTCC